jgi:hypothetical protein
MPTDDRDVLEVLKAELDFIEKGGYGRSVRTPWLPTSVFQDSLTPRPCPESRYAQGNQRLSVGGERDVMARYLVNPAFRFGFREKGTNDEHPCHDPGLRLRYISPARSPAGGPRVHCPA